MPWWWNYFECRNAEVHNGSDEPVNWIWLDNAAYGKGDQPDLKGIQDADPHLRFRKGKITLPTSRTPKAHSLAITAEHIKTGLFRKDGVLTPVVGAIPYPGKGRIKPLTEKMVGPGLDYTRN